MMEPYWSATNVHPKCSSRRAALENILDALKEKPKKLPEQKECIRAVIAPTYGQHSLLEIDNGELCCNILDILANANIEVTLRPHWMTINNNPTLISKIAERQKGYKTFSLIDFPGH